MTSPAPCHVPESTTPGTLFVAFELSETTWKLGFTTGPGQKPRECKYKCYLQLRGEQGTPLAYEQLMRDTR